MKKSNFSYFPAKYRKLKINGLQTSTACYLHAKFEIRVFCTFREIALTKGHPTTHPPVTRLVQFDVLEPQAVKIKVHRFVQHPIVRSSPLKRSGMDHTVFTLQTHHNCLHLVSVHKKTQHWLVITAIRLQLTTHLSTLRGRKVSWSS